MAADHDHIDDKPINAGPRTGPHSVPRSGSLTGTPSDAAQIDEEAERVLGIVRASMFRAHPFRYALVVVLAIGGLAAAGAAQFSESVAGWVLWPGLIAAVIGLIWFGIWWFDTHLSHKLTVTNKRSIQRIGFFSRNTSEVLHEHIRNIRIDQNLIQRLFKVGKLRVDSAAGGGENEFEIDMADVPSPHALKELIDPYRRL